MNRMVVMLGMHALHYSGKHTLDVFDLFECTLQGAWLPISPSLSSLSYSNPGPAAIGGPPLWSLQLATVAARDLYLTVHG